MAPARGARRRRASSRVGLVVRVLVTGAGGQVGQALVRLGTAGEADVVGVDRAALDITDAAAVRRVMAEVRPVALVNAAAYTAVDRAESEPDLAFRINRDGARRVAQEAAAAGVALVHLSTDYVFDGTKEAPYLPDDPVSPLSVYGASKAAGEAEVLAAGGRAVVLRTAWVFSGYAPNFVRTILRLAAERSRLSVVADQWGHPTAAVDVARGALAAARFARTGGRGVLHLGGSPVTTWHALAEAVVALASETTGEAPTPVDPIPSSAYPTAARRPARVELDLASSLPLLGLAEAPDWHSALRGAVREAARKDKGI